MACLALTCTVAAQRGTPPPAPQAQTPTFRTITTLVPVDVRVIDRQGQPVTDLTQGDFTILENGVRQTIRHFAALGLSADDAAAKTSSIEARNGTSDPLQPENRRVFLILLGNGRLQPPAKGVDGAIAFVRQHLLPQDLVAVMAWNRATDFTTDHEQIAQLLERFKKMHEEINANMQTWFSGLRAVYGGPEIPEPIQKKIDVVFGSAGAPGVHTVTAQAANAARIAGDQRQTTDALQTADIINTASLDPTHDAATHADEMSTAGLAGMSLDEYASLSVSSNQDLQKLYAAINYLRYLDGEKHVIYLTENGIALPRQDDDDSLAELANDARVSVDVIKTGGVAAMGRAGRGVMAGPTALFQIATLRNFTKLTGGELSTNEYAVQALTTIDASSRFSYLLGYYPSNPTLDDAYRHIVVRVNRPGVTVLFRHGYFASAQLTPLDREKVLTYRRVAEAGSFTQDIKDIALRVTATPSDPAAARPEVQVAMLVDMTRLGFVTEGDRHADTLEIAVFCGDKNGNPIGDLWRALSFKLTDATFAQYQSQGGIPINVTVPVTGVARYAKVVVYDHKADLIGAVQIKMN